MSGLIAILGPTGSGKTAVAVELAHEFGGDVVSCDSMQVYRGMDIGTAKPAIEERRGVRHHLLDVAEIAEPYDVRRYVGEARPVVRRLLAGASPCWLCGGTGLYAKALLEGYLFQPMDPVVAAAVAADMARAGADALAAELAAADAAVAARVAGNPRRLARAVEVLRLTGRPPAPDRCPQEAFPDVCVLVLLPDPEISQRRIHARADAMFRRGWMDETQALMENGLARAPTARQALGYAQIIDFLQRPGGSVAELMQAVKTATCRYARRQRTWFRHQHSGAHIVPITGGVVAPDVVASLRPLVARFICPGAKARRCRNR